MSIRPPYRGARAAETWLLGLAAGTVVDPPARPPVSDTALCDALANMDARLLPAVTEGLRTAGWLDRLTPDARLSLRRRRLSALAIHLRQGAWLRKFLRETLPADLPITLLKGWAFDGALYPDHAPRPGGDIDLLVREQDFDRLCRLLAQIARPVAIYVGRPFSRRTRFECGFWADDAQRLCIEPHFCLVHPGLVAVDQADMWDRCVVHPAYHDARIRMLAPEDALLHLAAHAFVNQNGAPHALVDAARLLRGAAPNLEVARRRAEGWGIARVLDLFLRHVAEHVAGIEIPGPVQPQTVSGWRTRLAAHGLAVDRRSDDGRRLAFRARQILSLGLLDRPLRALPFVVRYAGLRVLDAVRLPTGEPVASPDALAAATDRMVRYRGISMYPTLRDGELLRLEPLGATLPRAGDVIVFAGAHPGHQIIHRVLRRQGGAVVTRGDNNDRIDRLAPLPAAIRGRVVSVCRAGRDLPVAGGWLGQGIGQLARIRNALARRLAFRGRTPATVSSLPVWRSVGEQQP